MTDEDRKEADRKADEERRRARDEQERLARENEEQQILMVAAVIAACS